MDIKEMTVEELIERRAAIAVDVDAPEADLDSLEAEARAINEELEARKQAEEIKAETRAAIADGDVGEVVEEIVEERKEMTIEEVRSSKEYIDAFANYIKSGDDAECRALLTTLVSGQVPVPQIVEERIRTAWSRLGLLDQVRKTYVRGILKVGFELTAGPAYAHTEGTTAVTEEALTFGVVTLTPKSIKKWITISDEALDLGGEEFLDYIYDEITYQIAKKVQGDLIAAIAALGSAGATAVGVPAITASSISIATVAQALGQLSDEAANPCVVMNKATWAAFKAAQYGANYAIDPFEGLPVYFDNTLPAFSSASNNAVFMIVGDFSRGAQANFPNGNEISIKFDDLSLAEKDLVKLVGREYVALGIVGDKCFCNVKKTS
jgi:HK97 family phage major capsid protein